MAASFPLERPQQIVFMVAAALAYTWLYESWLSDDEDSPAEQESSLFRLNAKGERMRWRFANAAILVILLETIFNVVRSWGIYFALLTVAAAYMGSPFLTRWGGEIELTPRQQAIRRRWGILPAALLLYKGTDFRVGTPYAVVLLFAGLVFAVLILVPEPRASCSEDL